MAKTSLTTTTTTTTFHFLAAFFLIWAATLGNCCYERSTFRCSFPGEDFCGWKHLSDDGAGPLHTPETSSEDQDDSRQEESSSLSNDNHDNDDDDDSDDKDKEDDNDSDEKDKEDDNDSDDKDKEDDNDRYDKDKEDDNDSNDKDKEDDNDSNDIDKEDDNYSEDKGDDNDGDDKDKEDDNDSNDKDKEDDNYSEDKEDDNDGDDKDKEDDNYSEDKDKEDDNDSDEKQNEKESDDNDSELKEKGEEEDEEESRENDSNNDNDIISSEDSMLHSPEVEDDEDGQQDSKSKQAMPGIFRSPKFCAPPPQQKTCLVVQITKAFNRSRFKLSAHTDGHDPVIDIPLESGTLFVESFQSPFWLQLRNKDTIETSKRMYVAVSVTQTPAKSQCSTPLQEQTQGTTETSPNNGEQPETQKSTGSEGTTTAVAASVGAVVVVALVVGVILFVLIRQRRGGQHLPLCHKLCFKKNDGGEKLPTATSNAAYGLPFADPKQLCDEEKSVNNASHQTEDRPPQTSEEEYAVLENTDMYDNKVLGVGSSAAQNPYDNPSKQSSQPAYAALQSNRLSQTPEHVYSGITDPGKVQNGDGTGSNKPETESVYLCLEEVDVSTPAKEIKDVQTPHHPTTTEQNAADASQPAADLSSAYFILEEGQNATTNDMDLDYSLQKRQDGDDALYCLEKQQ